MKKIILSLLVLITSLFFSVKAENLQTVSRNFPVRLIEKIEIKGSSKVVYTQGEKTEVVVRGASDLVDLIIIENKGNRLIVSQKDNTESIFTHLSNRLKNGFKEPEEAVVYVTTPDLLAVSLVGSGDFIANGSVDTDNLDIVLRGSGDIDFPHIICDNLHAQLLGSGDVKLKDVTTIRANYELKGSGDIDVTQQHVRQTYLNLYGSGDIKVRCSQCDNVNASLTGSGDIDVYGEVLDFNQSSHGSGDIEYHK